MKAGAKPELTAAWWKKNKAKTLTKTGLSAALLEYEKWAKLDRNEDLAKQVKALGQVKRAVANAVQKANTTLHKETIAALKKYPKVIEDRLRYLKGVKARVDAAPKQSVGRNVVIWERDVKKLTDAWLRKNNLTEKVPPMKRGSFKLTLNDDILDVLEEHKDRVTPALMVETAEKAWKSTEGEIHKAYQAWPSRPANENEVKRAKAKLESSLDKSLTSLRKTLQSVPENQWKKFVAREKKYKAYKVKATVDAVWEVASFGANVALTVGSGGASLVLSLVGLVKSAAKMAGMLYDAVIEAETVHKSLTKDLAALQSSYLTFQGKAKKTLGPKEVLKATASGVFGDVARPFLQTIPRCESNFTLWSRKVDGLAVKGRKCSAATMDALTAVNKVEKMLAKEDKKRVKKLMKDVDTLRTKLDDALKANHAVMARVRKADGEQPKVAKDLKMLKDAQSKPVAFLAKLIPHLVDIGTGAWSGKLGVDEAKNSVDLIKTGAGITIGIVAEAKAVYDDV